MAANFHVFSALETGPSHLERGVGCEDFIQIRETPDGDWLSAVVCDGCGSADKAAEGAQYISRFICSGLLDLTTQLKTSGPGEWVVDEIVILVANLRKSMRLDLSGPINDYAATIVAVLISDKGGFVFHIGDGVATTFSVLEQEGKLFLNSAMQSDPENGEYVNVTFYPTEPGWIKHVRITPIQSCSAIFLGTDGAQDIFYNGNTPFDAAICPVLSTLLKSPNQGNKTLQAILGSKEAQKRSSDDKGAVVIVTQALQQQFEKNASQEIYSSPLPKQTEDTRPSDLSTSPKTASTKLETENTPVTETKAKRGSGREG